MSGVEMQYGQGLVDWAHVETTPLSTAAVGVYVPLPTTESKLLLAYRRGAGLEVDVR